MILSGQATDLPKKPTTLEVWWFLVLFRYPLSMAPEEKPWNKLRNDLTPWRLTLIPGSNSFQQSIVRLMNAMASIKSGRDYLGYCGKVVSVLINSLVQGGHHVLWIIELWDKSRDSSHIEMTTFRKKMMKKKNHLEE